MTLFLLATSRFALACGGMFCDAVAPVDQAAERIVFAFDGDQVTTEVQITFSGQDDSFAWVVPVPAEPELFVSNDALFTQLANATIPTFTLQSDTAYGCGARGYATDKASSDTGFASFDSADSYGGGVTVVSEATVGPYETVVLQANDSATLVSWLQDQAFNLPDGLDGVLTPYVAADQYFVALKLSSDKDSGDLAPLGMRYPATAASIPIQLTSIAAVADLPIEVFVLGPSRAVPDNYLHVQIDEAAIDWYAGGTNYRDVVARAVDEAGGQAFATDYSGSTANFDGLLWFPGMIDTDRLARITDPIEWLDSILFSAVPPSSQLNDVLIAFVPPPEGVDATTFLSCPDCYGADVPDFDPVAATEALQTEVLDVLKEQQARIDAAPHLTRLFTTMDPGEMTADPLFAFNADIGQEVSATHTATDQMFVGCSDASESLELADGRTYRFGYGDTDALDDVDSPAALIIEDLGTSGAGTVVFDGTEDAEHDAKAFSGGCGGPKRSVAVPVMLLLGALWRRSRR